MLFAKMASAAETYCLCGQPYNIGQFMIECDCCREWYHGSCVNVKVYQSEDIDKYHCPKCVSTYGPSIYRVPTNEHRQDRYEINADRKATQTGSKVFIKNLIARKFPFQHVVILQGAQFTETYLKENGFNIPILFETIAGLDLRVPPANTFSIRTVARHCGSSREIDVIDVTRQTNFKMGLGDFVDYFTSQPEERGDKTLNVLSLEFTDTPMAALVWPPLMARQLDWVRVVWPSEAPPFSPMVQRYCIMSPANSYTDFHLDFGGTTVWYHVLHGEKLFYLIPPTQTNLSLYQQWSTSTNQSEVFFGDLVESCGMSILKKGQTLFIPTGWIHAVFTPEDSLVFGGNFLHSLNIELQLQVYEIERQIDTPSIFRFPQFETIHWYAGAHLLQQLRRINEEQQDKDFTVKDGVKDNVLKIQRKTALDLPPYLVRGVRILAAALKEWNASKTYDQSKKDAIPDTVNSSQLVRELSRELKRLEKLLSQSSFSSPHCSGFKKKKKKQKSHESKLHKIQNQLQPDRHFAAVSAQKALPSMPLHYDPMNPRSLYGQQSQQSDAGHQATAQPSSGRKGSLKLTLPKPIMHVQDSNQMFSNSSQDSEDAELNNIANLASHSGLATFSQGYDSQDSFGAENDYRVPGDHLSGKKSSNPYTELTSNERGGAVLKIKLGSPPSVSLGSPQQQVSQKPPPDYGSTEHSILKSHLIGNTNNSQGQQKSSNQWTISKSQVKNIINDTTDEQILFTNENLTMPGTSHTAAITAFSNSSLQYDNNGLLYGPGMYENESMPQQQVVGATENYDPDFVIDRKNGVGLPNYSPTKSMNEFLGQSKSAMYTPQTPANVKPSYSALTTATPVNFANHSDPYSQTVRSQDGASPFSDDSSVLTGTDGYSLIQDDCKSAELVQGKMTVLQTADFQQSNQREDKIYEYLDSKGQMYKTSESLMYKTEQEIYKTEESVYKLEQQQAPFVYKDSRNVLRQNVIQQHTSQQMEEHDTISFSQSSQLPQVETPIVPPPAYSSHTSSTTHSRRTDRPSRRRIEPKASSIYDYYEDPEDGGNLYIDETPAVSHSGHKSKKKKDKGIKITLPGHLFRQEAANSRNASYSVPKNGIESLLQASEYTGSSDNQERDAVAGMLSIGQSYGLARVEPSTSRRSIPATEAPPIRAVHKDDEYVYPSLDMSSDEEDIPPSRRSHNSKSKKKTNFSTPNAHRNDKEDESWSPRGRLGCLLPRLNHPTRRGSRKEAVQAALKAARMRGTHTEESTQVAPVSLQSSPMLLSGGVPPSPSPAPHPAATPVTPHVQPHSQHHPHSSGSVVTHSTTSSTTNNGIPPMDSIEDTIHVKAPLPAKIVTITTTPLAPSTSSSIRHSKESVADIKKPSRKKRLANAARAVPSVQHVLPSPVAPKVQKFKKGMKTAKQRLGKILKIHKMI